MTPQQRLEEIKKLNPPTQDMLQWADDQDLLNCIKNIYQPNQAWLISRIEQLEGAIKPILWLNDCRCPEEYTGRQLHAPNTNCGELDDLIEALNSGPKPGVKKEDK